MESLLADPNLLFPETDKGLGPCAVTYDQYIEDCLLHLKNPKCYRQLSASDAKLATAMFWRQTFSTGWINMTITLMTMHTSTSKITPLRLATAPLGNSMCFTKSTRV